MGLNTRFLNNVLPVCCQILCKKFVFPQPNFNLYFAPIVLSARAGSVLIRNRNCNMSTSKETGSDFSEMQKTKGSRRSALKSAKPVKIEYEKEDEEEEDKKPAKRIRQRQEDKQVDVDVKKETGPKSPKAEVGETIEPTNWRQIVENIRAMRVDNPAPVDTMGCERTHDNKAAPEVQRFQTLISLLLSSQTKDGVTFAAMGRLKDYGCTPEKMLEIPESDLKAMLNPVGFYNKKAANIKKVSQILLDKYGGDIPETSQGLMELPGIGPKMAYICMQVAWGVNEGIGVDTHVHRISERLGWTSAKGKKKLTPEDTRKQLESWLPKDMWQDVNILLVGFGQTICNPTAPKCHECLNKALCPFGRKNSKSGQGSSKTK